MMHICLAFSLFIIGLLKVKFLFQNSKTVYRTLICFIGFFWATSTWSQGFKSAAEVGVFAGGSYYLGDLNTNRHFVDSKMALGLIFRYNLTTRYSMRFNATYGQIQGYDSDSKNSFQVNRNLSFNSKLLELAFGMEIDMFKYRITDMKYPISPYFFYQFAYTRFNPKTNYNGNEVPLQPLGTEGQGTGLAGTKKNRYSLNQFTVPLGIGLKFNFCPRVAMSIEYGIRKTFTDYLDDVSGKYIDGDYLRAANGPLAADLANRSIVSYGSVTGSNRGNSKAKDWYSFYGIMITVKPFKKDICDMRGWR